MSLCGAQHPDLPIACTEERNHFSHCARHEGQWILWDNVAYTPPPPPPTKARAQRGKAHKLVADLERKTLTRTDDPETSKRAAQTLDLSNNERVRAAVDLVRTSGPMTHHEIGQRLFEMGVVPEAEMGRRAARTATEEFGMLVETGCVAKNRTGHEAKTYEVAAP